MIALSVPTRLFAPSCCSDGRNVVMAHTTSVHNARWPTDGGAHAIGGADADASAVYLRDRGARRTWKQKRLLQPGAAVTTVTILNSDDLGSASRVTPDLQAAAQPTRCMFEAETGFRVDIAGAQERVRGPCHSSRWMPLP